MFFLVQPFHETEISGMITVYETVNECAGFYYAALLLTVLHTVDKLPLF